MTRLGPGEGVRYGLGRSTLVFKRSADDEECAYSVMEAIEPPGAGASLHRHFASDERFIICEGRYHFQVGGEELTLVSGDSLFVPRGIPHSFECLGPEPGRQLIVSSPGGLFEAFIALREKNERQHKMFEQTLTRARDALTPRRMALPWQELASEWNSSEIEAPKRGLT